MSRVSSSNGEPEAITGQVCETTPQSLEDVAARETEGGRLPQVKCLGPSIGPDQPTNSLFRSGSPGFSSWHSAQGEGSGIECAYFRMMLCVIVTVGPGLKIETLGQSEGSAGMELAVA